QGLVLSESWGGGEDRSASADEHENVGELSQEDSERADPRRLNKLVWADPGEPRGRLTGREADRRTLQPLEAGFWRERVPVVRHRAPNHRTRNKAHHGHPLELDPRPVPR